MTDFEWPWEYTFPPFFTLQIHEETRHKQLDVWCDLFLKYLKHINKFNINIHENAFPLFYNQTLNRRLSPEMILKILDRLQSTKHAHPLNKERIQWQVYWHTLEEYGDMIYEWIQETGQTNSVCTLYEISQGESSTGKPFYNIEESVLLNVLRRLEEKGRCELIELDGSYGVKFF